MSAGQGARGMTNGFGASPHNPDANWRQDRNFLFGSGVTHRKVPILTNKTKQNQAILLGFVWSGLDSLGFAWV